VFEREGERKLVMNNVFTLGGTMDPRWEALQSHIPLCMHPDPKRVLYLGMGTGVTAGASLDHPVEEVLVAEIVPEVIEAARAQFAEVTGALFTDDRVEIVPDDARHVLGRTEELWDVVIGDLFFPWEAGAANLYTREQFELVRSRLAEGGLFAQWLPCYQMSEEEVLGVAKTFAEVFPTAVLWRDDFFADRPLLALVGHAEEDVRLDAAGFKARVRALAGGYGDDLAAAAGTVPLHLYAGNLKAANDLLAGASVLTDDLPWIAYTAPKSERRRQSEEDTLFIGKRLLAFERALAAAVPAAEDPYLADLGEREHELVAAGIHLRAMAVGMATFDRSAYMRALKAYTDVVRAPERPDVSTWIK
jgi:spermidine synthase